MKLTRLKFFAFTNPGLERCLNREITDIVGSADVRNVFGKTGVEFRADFDQMVEIILRSRTINSLNVQIGHPVHAGNAKSIRTNLSLLNWTTYFDFRRTTVTFPSPITRSEQSDFSSEKELREIFIKTISDLATISEKSKPEEVIQDIDQRFANEEEVLKHFSELATHKPEIIFNSPFYLRIFKNKLLVMLNVFDSERNKAGLKQFVGWGSVRENVVAAFMLGTPLMDEFRESKTLKIFDPFCGSGTLLIEPLLNLAKYPLRINEIKKLDFWKWNALKNEELKTALETKIDKITENPVEDLEGEYSIALVGTDISKKQLECSINNFKELDRIDLLKKFKPANNKSLIEIKEDLKSREISYKNFDNKVLLINSSFDQVELPETFDGYTLLTNIPFGIQSGTEELDQTYKAFDRFLAKNHKKFSRIYIMNMANVDHDRNYVRKSRFGWVEVMDFSNGGHRMAFFQFNPDKKASQLDNAKVTILTTKKRRGSKPKVIKSVYDLRHIDKIKPNSKIASKLIETLRAKSRNQFLEKKKQHDEKVAQKVQKRIAHIEENEKKKVLSGFQELVGEEKMREFNTLLDANKKKLTKKTK